MPLKICQCKDPIPDNKRGWTVWGFYCKCGGYVNEV